MNNEVPGAALKLNLRSFNVASNIGKLHKSSQHPHASGNTPISKIESKDTFTTKNIKINCFTTKQKNSTQNIPIKVDHELD